jgi:hypothetical protein
MIDGDFEKCVQSVASVSPRDPFESSGHDAQPELLVPSDNDARLRLQGWLRKLPVGRSGEALELQAIARESGVAVLQARGLLPQVVQSDGGSWSVQEIGDGVIILHCPIE